MAAHNIARKSVVKSDTTPLVTQTPVPKHGLDSQPAQSETSQMLSGHVARVGQSWRAPFLVLSTLLAGLVCTLVHHFLNAFLNGRVVTDTSISQAWVLRVQTIFAFLVKMFLTVSIGAAFVQRQWWSFRQPQFSVREVDAVTTVLGNVFGLLTLSAWRKAPLLAAIALISW